MTFISYTFSSTLGIRILREQMMPKRMKSPQVKINGFIASKDRDQRGNLVQVSIETDKFERYIVNDDDRGRELFDFINQDIEVRGRVIGEDIDGNKIISISKYKMIPKQYINN